MPFVIDTVVIEYAGSTNSQGSCRAASTTSGVRCRKLPVLTRDLEKHVKQPLPHPLEWQVFWKLFKKYFTIKEKNTPYSVQNQVLEVLPLLEIRKKCGRNPCWCWSSWLQQCTTNYPRVLQNVPRNPNGNAWLDSENLERKQIHNITGSEIRLHQDKQRGSGIWNLSSWAGGHPKRHRQETSLEVSEGPPEENTVNHTTDCCFQRTKVVNCRKIVQRKRSLFVSLFSLTGEEIRGLVVFDVLRHFMSTTTTTTILSGHSTKGYF